LLFHFAVKNKKSQQRVTFRIRLLGSIRGNDFDGESSKEIRGL